MLWTLWSADLVQRVNQGVFVIRLERNVEVNGGASRRVTEGLPVGRDGIPSVLDTDVILRWCEELRDVVEWHGG